MKKAAYLLLLLAIIFAPLFGFAQGVVKIDGTILDEKTQEPIIGAHISLAGKTGNGAVSDADGNFSLRVPSLPATISVECLGYEKREVNVREADKPIAIQLREAANLLNEVVVVGYGVQRRRELTGAVATISKVALEQISTSIDGLLGGTVSGVNVTQTSGQPGAGSEIRIRGGNSVYASNEPLYVIDGFIYFSEKGATQAGASNISSSLNPLSSINPSDIESIEILKDVSAKAIYGSRGANGVILVTTKKGARGKNTVHYQYSTSIDKSSKKLSLMNAEQWTKTNRDGFHNTDWYNPVFVEFSKDKNIDTDWQDAVLRTGLTQTHELSFSGGDDKTRYLISGNYTNQEGIVLNSGFERFSGRVNLDRKLYENFTVGINASANSSTQNALTTLVAGDFAGSSNPFKSGVTNSLVYALFMPPVLPVYGENGEYNHYNPFELTELSYYGTAANPVRDLKESIGQTVGATLLGNFYAKYDIPYIEGLSAKFSAGTNVNYITQNFFSPPKTVLGINEDIQGRASVGNRRTDVSQMEYLLAYTKQITPIHYVDVLGGYTYQKTNTNIVIAKADHIEQFKQLGAGEAKRHYSFDEQGNLHSLLGRVNYTLLNRYNLTATFRADNSSRFATGHRWGYFPSIGLSWNVDDEAFFAEARNILPTLKIRATYGAAGNQEIGFSEFDVLRDYVEYGGEPALVLTNPGNSKLKWEVTTEYNAGIDAGFLGNRLTLTADVYYKETSDLLSTQQVWPENKKQTFNIGSLTNKGFELSLNARLVEHERFSWSAAANFARNVNTIKSLAEDNYVVGSSEEQILRVGESFGSFYGYIYDGVVQADDELPLYDPQPGAVKLRDINDVIGDGKITRDGDRTIIGSIQPDFTYGFSTTFTYGKWDFFASFQGSHGNEVYNSLRRHLSENNRTRNLSADLLNAWTAENPSKEVPRLDAVIDANTLYSRYVEDGSFLKLRNLTLGYTLPVKVHTLPTKFRFFVSGQNLLTFTKYTGYDPEVAGGIDTGLYPASRTWLFGAGITF